MHEGLLDTRDELHHVPAEPQAEPVKSFDLQAKYWTVSVVAVSGSDGLGVLPVNVCVTLGAIVGLETEDELNNGAWFT